MHFEVSSGVHSQNIHYRGEDANQAVLAFATQAIKADYPDDIPCINADGKLIWDDELKQMLGEFVVYNFDRNEIKADLVKPDVPHKYFPNDIYEA